MPVNFTSEEKRDELRDRLKSIAQSMRRSFDQGHDGTIFVSEEMIGDILTAAAVVGATTVTR